MQLLVTTTPQPLLELPAQPWRPVVWRKAGVDPERHILLDTIKYYVTHQVNGLVVDVRIIDHFVVAGDQVVGFAERGVI